MYMKGSLDSRIRKKQRVKRRKKAGAEEGTKEELGGKCEKREAKVKGGKEKRNRGRLGRRRRTKKDWV